MLFRNNKPKNNPNPIKNVIVLAIDIKLKISIKTKQSADNNNKNIKIIGFKLTSHADSKAAVAAVQKLFKNKRVSYVVQNDVTQIDRKKGVHKFSLFQKNNSSGENLNSRDQLIGHLSKIILSPLLVGGEK